MLEARARVLLASQGGSKDDRRRAIERAIDRLDRAEQIDPAVPSALFAERARYHAALGQTRAGPARSKALASRSRRPPATT